MADFFGGYDAEDIDTSYGPQDGDYTLVCTSAEKKISKAGNEMLVLMFKVVDGGPNDTVRHQLMYPTSDNPENNGRYRANMKRLFMALELPMDGSVEVKDFKDIEITATVFTETKDGYTNKRLKNIQRSSSELTVGGITQSTDGLNLDPWS